MKVADGDVIAILAAGQALKAEMWRFVLQSGTTLYFTDHDVPITVDVADDALGAQTWQTGIQFSRGNVVQKIGLEVQTLSVEITPQADHPGGAAITLPQIRARLLEGCRVTLFKMFCSDWLVPKRPVSWFQGRVSDIEFGRFSARLNLQSDTELLNVAMPRNLLQQGCIWTLYGAGCQLSPAAFTFARTVSATGPNTISSFTTNDAHADAYFGLGKATFTSGANAGLTRPVRFSQLSNGRITLIMPLPVPPANGDGVTLIAGCDKRQTPTCDTKFGNIARYRGYPYVPVPETLYDGGAAGNNASVPTLGEQGVPSGGSNVGGRFGQPRSFS